MSFRSVLETRFGGQDNQKQSFSLAWTRSLKGCVLIWCRSQVWFSLPWMEKGEIGNGFSRIRLILFFWCSTLFLSVHFDVRRSLIEMLTSYSSLSRIPIVASVTVISVSERPNSNFWSALWIVWSYGALVNIRHEMYCSSQKIWFIAKIVRYFYGLFSTLNRRSSFSKRSLHCSFFC